MSSPEREQVQATVQPEVSVVVPTYNEAENIEEVLNRLTSALHGHAFEIIVVDDDSPDRTWALAEAQDDPRIRVIRRVSDRGLSSAILTGLQASLGDVIAVIDADMQHDEAILPGLVDAVRRGSDIAIGSRRAEGGSFGEWSAARRFVSWSATKMARLVLNGSVGDPMSGYFACSRRYLRSVEGQLNPRGFKILLELLARGNPAVVEIGYTFRTRARGETKLTTSVMLDYLYALVQLRLGLAVSERSARYASVGAVGAVVNLAGYLLARLAGIDRLLAVVVGVELSIVFNYVVNRKWTFSAGSAHFVTGLFVYQIFSSHALFVQAASFQMLRGWTPFADLAAGGMVLANAIAIGVASVGNYAIHANYTARVLDHLVRRSAAGV
jgi:dolichol-phosphate mannosyltransferase